MKLRPHLGPVLGYAAIVVAFFAPVLLRGGVLLPVDNLFAFEPWRSFAPRFGVDEPHNPLIGDAILQNYPWKRLILEAVAQGTLPLWNPYILAGQPFLATGQPGALYPFGVLFVLLPTAHAYAPFIALHLWLGAVLTYTFLVTLGARRLPAFLGGAVFALSGPLVVSFLWPMVVSAFVWLPALLTLVELCVRRFERLGGASPSSLAATAVTALPCALGSGVVTGLSFLAGHFEFSFYVVASAGMYAMGRLGALVVRRALRQALVAGLLLLTGVGLGVGLAAPQLLPFAEVAGANYRVGRASYEEVVGYALPWRHALAFLMPNAFGNPTHHSYVDLLDGHRHPVEHQFHGETRRTTEWGVKNYVEGAVYVGVVPLLLALAAVLVRPGFSSRLFAGLSLVCVLFAFGTPLYAVLFFGLPGFEQLRTPFRWVYPLAFFLAVLAGLGADALTQRSSSREANDPSPHDSRDRWQGDVALAAPRRQRDLAARLLGGGALALGLALCFSLAAAYLYRFRLAEALDAVVARSATLGRGFPDGRAFFSYQFGNLAGLAALLTVGGVLVLLWRRRWAPWAALAVTVLDLLVAGLTFNTVASPDPLRFTPPAIELLQRDREPFRIATFGEEDLLPANTALLFGLHDARGYDSVILKQYTEYMALVDRRGVETMLPFNRVEKLLDPPALTSPLLDLLNVRYVLTSTSREIDAPGFTQVYEGEVRVYRNDEALPRAFLVERDRVVDDPRAALETLARPDFDPRAAVVLEATDPAIARLRDWTARHAGAATFPSPCFLCSDAPGNGTARIARYGLNEVEVAVHVTAPAYLVLTDAYFPGWVATVDGEDRPLLRAYRIFRAVPLEPGDHLVTFAYKPFSLRLGGVVAVLSLATMGLGGMVWVWQRWGSRAATSTAGRVAVNSLVPTIASLGNKGLDLGFAVVMLRVLGPEAVGKYTWAVVFIGYVDILINFGLNTLITRDVAADRSAAARYFGNTLATRLALWLLAALLTGLAIGPGAAPLGVDEETARATALLLVGMLPSAVAATASAIFLAHERMEVPAAVTTLTTVLKVGLGLAALVAGWGIVGLAAASVVVNLTTALVLVGLMSVLLLRPRWEFQAPFSKRMVRESYPLMLNNLLNSLFFRLDAMLLQPLAGSLALGYYGTAYKFIDGLLIIPSHFTLALFPLMARFARAEREALARTFTLGLKTLLAIALPISVGTTLLAEPIVLLLGGPAYVPGSVWALRILIWFLPFSFVNGITQYVLIALNRQRAITLAFALGTTFNLLTNLAAIPRFGYLGAAATTVLSELVLLVPFWYLVRRHLPSVRLLPLVWRPTLAAAVMGAAVWPLTSWAPALAVPTGALVYLALLVALGAMGPDERDLLRKLLRRESAPAP